MKRFLIIATLALVAALAGMATDASAQIRRQQIWLDDGTGKFTVLNSAALGSSSTLTIPDAGTTANVLLTNGGGIERTGYVASDVTTTSATATAITGLSFAVGANEKWAFECFINNKNALLGTGINYSVTGPGTVTIEASAVGILTATVPSLFARITGTGLSTPFNTVLGGDGWIRISGLISCSTAGTVQINQASNDGTTTSTAYKYSYIVARKL
jgi:hypothetical protein